MARKTKAEAQETRHLLLDAATRVFSARGVARTTLQDVASAAGMTRGAVYWHFKDKADLFNAMIDRVVLPWEEAHEALLANAPDDPLQTLAQLATEPLQRLEAAPNVQQVFLIAMHLTEYTGELAQAWQHQQGNIDTYLAEMQALFTRAAERGLLRPGLTPSAAAHGLYALVDGLMRHWLRQPQSFSLTEAGSAAVGAYLAGAALRASPPAARAAAPQKSPAPPTPST